MNEIEINVRFGECDPAGIAFYPNFFKWYDHGLWTLFSTIGLTRDTAASRYGILGWPLVSAESRFLSPTKEGDRLTLRTEIARWGRSSFDVQHRLRRGDTAIAEGLEKRVWAAAKPGGGLIPLPIPDEIRAMLGPVPAG